MKESSRRGKRARAIEISDVSSIGFSIKLGCCEYDFPIDENPWFKDATIAQLSRVVLFGENHLHWPDLDVDIEIDAIKNPEKYPLIYR